MYYTPEKGKIYVDISEYTEYSGKTYRWSGTKYAVISETLALGEVTGTAYDGSKGRKATAITNSLPNTIVDTLEFGKAYANYVQLKYHYYSKQFATTQGDDHYEAQSHGHVDIPIATTALAGVMSAADKTKLDKTLPNQITELSNNVYTKEEINNKFNDVPTVENTYTKAEVDKAIADAIKALIPAGYEFVIKKKTT